jgi:drug/metabolite transporter (DMT)-like permease
MGKGGAPGLPLKTKLLTFVVILSNVLGNFALSWGMKAQSPDLGASPAAYIRTIFHPWVAVGIVLLILWMVLRMALLSLADLSYVLPVTALGYVLAAVLGRIFYHEDISWQRWGGILLIVAGISLVGLTRAKTTAPESGR